MNSTMPKIKNSTQSPNIYVSGALVSTRTQDSATVKIYQQPIYQSKRYGGESPFMIKKKTSIVLKNSVQNQVGQSTSRAKFDGSSSREKLDQLDSRRNTLYRNKQDRESQMNQTEEMNL
jgi:hypothetical protein